MTCHNCKIEAKKFGKDRKGNQRYRCVKCSKTFQEAQEKPLDNMRIPMEKATLCLRLLVEGNSLRSVERITGVGLRCILDLLLLAGKKRERLLDERIKDLPVCDVEVDELWGYVAMKEKTKRRKLRTESTLGDAWTFVALERHTKLVLAWHLGRRQIKDTVDFTEKLYKATSGRFKLTADGFAAYPDAVSYSLGTRVDYAQLIKIYAHPRDAEYRYTPPEVVETLPKPRFGNPDPERICTSHVERQNLTMRMMRRRLTRLTNAFSKKWENLRAALALHFAYYNFCRAHKSLRCTPAMEAGIAKTIWSVEDLLNA
jgi:transposase-like protein/IS1 family transposase